MQKEVIYLDNEDDITTIIGKLKSAKQKIVALVPPKRVGVLQSAVNLRLLARTAEQNDKRLVIITNNHALSALSASAKIPVAKNLQSKPELGEIAALDIDDGNDVIDGIDLPVGEHAAQTKEKDRPVDKAVGEIATATAAGGSPVIIKDSKPNAKDKKDKKKAVPNFNSFRKKLIIGISAGVLLIGFLVWALVFAPRAIVAVTMRTSDISINQLVSLTTDGETKVDDTTIKADVQSISEEVEVSFDATGERDVGEKAKGTVRLSTRDIENLGSTVPAGTSLTSSSGKVYKTDEAVTFSLSNYRGVEVGVTADESGESYNGATGSMSGAPSGVSARLTDPTSGGTTRMIDVVTEEDIEKAKTAAESKIDRKAMEDRLTERFDDEYIVIPGSLQVNTGDFSSNVDVDAEARGGRAVYGGEATFRLYAVSKEQLKSYLNELLEKQLDNPTSQRIYEDGVDETEFTNFRRSNDNLSMTLSTTGKIGPKIDDSEVKEQAAGKRFGEVQQALTGIDGVSEVDVQLSPFWVTTVPGNPEKIVVEFKVDG